MSNPTQTMTLIDFLLARIAEDEAVARAATWSSPGDWAAVEKDGSLVIETAPDSMPWEFGGGSGVWSCDDPEDDCGTYRANALAESEHIARHDPARVLAECAAKRLVLTMHEDYMSSVRAYRSPRWQEVEDDANRADRLKAEARGQVSSDYVQALAQPYADHPEFRDEWRWENR